MKQNPKIVITPETKYKLDSLRLTPSETYEEIIKRLIGILELQAYKLSKELKEEK